MGNSVNLPRGPGVRDTDTDTDGGRTRTGPRRMGVVGPRRLCLGYTMVRTGVVSDEKDGSSTDTPRPQLLFLNHGRCVPCPPLSPRYLFPPLG